MVLICMYLNPKTLKNREVKSLLLKVTSREKNSRKTA